MKSIYQIQNKINGKRYYGSSVDIKARWYVHKGRLNNNIHKNPHLQSSWNKHGEENFSFEIILLCEEFELFRYEQWFLDNVVKWKFDYNIAECAEAPARGKSLSEITKNKISKKCSGEKHHMWGKAHSKETREKMSIAAKGRKFSEDHKRKLSKAHLGKIHSEETKRKMSGLRGSYNKNGK